MINRKRKYLIAFVLFCFVLPVSVFANEQIRILLSNKAAEIFFQNDFAIYAEDKLIKKVNNETINLAGLKNYKNIFIKNINNGLFKIGPYKYKGDLKIIFDDRNL